MFNPHDYLEFAEELKTYKPRKDEAACRTMISRAYYSAYLAAREECKKGLLNTACGPEFTSLYDQPEMHAVVHEIVEKIDKHVGNLFYSLRDKRNTSDYKLGIMVNRTAAEDAISTAQELFQVTIPTLGSRLSTNIVEIDEIVVKWSSKLKKKREY